MKTLILIIWMSFSQLCWSQGIESYFKTKDIQIDIPVFLPGIVHDPEVLKIDDTLRYRLKGQLFADAPLAIDSFSLPYPWQMINELTSAYLLNDKKKLTSLFNKKSQNTIYELVNGPMWQEMADVIKTASSSNLRVLAGVRYKEGYMIFSADDKYGLHENFVVVENGKYKFSALEDSSALLWNLALYFKFIPSNTFPLTCNMPDSLHFLATSNVDVTLPPGTSWIAIYEGGPGEPVQLLIEDNGINDFNPDVGKINFEIAGNTFYAKGTHSYYLAAFNYPIQSIHSKLLLPGFKREIVIY